MTDPQEPAASPIDSLSVNEVDKREQVDINAPQNMGVAKMDIDWNRALAWWKPISMTLPISWRLSHLLLCAIGVFLTGQYVGGIKNLFGVSLLIDSQDGRLAQFSATDPASVIGSEIITGTDSSTYTPESLAALENFQGMFFSQRGFQFSFMNEWLTFLTPIYAWIASPSLQMTAYCVALAIGFIGIWGFIGGCIVRRSVVELGTGLVPSWNDTIRWIRQRWLSIVWALTMPVCGALMLCVIPLLVGLIAKIPVIGYWTAGIALLPVSLLVIAIGWTLAITLLGFPMAMAAIVTEKKADAFDGISRSAAYLFQRPVAFLLYIMAFEIISRLGGAMFWLILSTGKDLFNRMFLIGASANAQDFLFVWNLPGYSLPYFILAAFSLSYFWTAQSALYLLLRKSVDSTELDLVDLGESSVSK